MSLPFLFLTYIFDLLLFLLFAFLTFLLMPLTCLNPGVWGEIRSVPTFTSQFGNFIAYIWERKCRLAFGHGGFWLVGWLGEH